MKQLHIQSLINNAKRGIATTSPVTVHSASSSSSTAPRLSSAALSAALLLVLLLAFVPSGDIVTMAEAVATTLAPTTAPTVVDCATLYARNQHAYFFGSEPNGPYALSYNYVDRPLQDMDVNNDLFMSLRGGVTVDCPNSMFSTGSPTDQTGKGKFLFVLYSSEPGFDKASPYRVTVTNTAFTYTNAPCGVMIGGIYESVTDAEIDDGTYGPFIIDVSNNVFRRRASGNDIDASAFNIYDRIPPGSIITLTNNVFEATVGYLFNSAPHGSAIVGTSEAGYRRDHGCYTMDVQALSIGARSRITIEANHLLDGRCYYKNWKGVTSGKNDEYPTENAPITIGVPWTGTPVGHDTVIVVKDNLLEKVSCNTNAQGVIDASGFCATHGIWMGTLQPQTGCNISIVGNNITGNKVSPANQKFAGGIDLRKFVFAQRPDGDTRSPANLYIKQNYIEATDHHTYAIRMEPHNTNYYKSNDGSQVRASLYTAPDSEGGRIEIEENTFINYIHPISIEFPGGNHRTFAPSTPHYLSVSENTMRGALLVSPLTLVNTTLDVPESMIVVEGNRFHLNHTHPNAFITLDRVNLFNRTSIKVVSNYGEPVNSSRPISNTTFLVAARWFNKTQGALRSNVTTFTIGGYSEIAFCNNTLHNKSFTSNTPDLLKAAGIGFHLDTFGNVHCYRCGCKEHGTPARADRWCPTRPYCCSIAEDAPEGSALFIADCPYPASDEDPFPMTRRAAGRTIPDGWTGL